MWENRIFILVERDAGCFAGIGEFKVFGGAESLFAGITLDLFWGFLLCNHVFSGLELTALGIWGVAVMYFGPWLTAFEILGFTVMHFSDFFDCIQDLVDLRSCIFRVFIDRIWNFQGLRSNISWFF